MTPQFFDCMAPKPTGTAPLLKEVLYEAVHHDFNLVRLDPHTAKAPQAYAAGDAIMLVMAGSLRLTVDGQDYPLAAGQLAVVPQGAHRGFVAGPAGATLLAAHLRG